MEHDIKEKKKAGRPRKAPTIPVGFRLPEELIERVRAVSEHQQRTISICVANALELWLEQNE